MSLKTRKKRKPCCFFSPEKLLRFIVAARACVPPGAHVARGVNGANSWTETRKGKRNEKQNKKKDVRHIGGTCVTCEMIANRASCD